MTSIPAILRGLNRARVRYLLICGSASAIHGVSRTTVDLDLLDLTLYPEDENVRRALGALREMDFIPETNRLDKIIGQGGVTATDNRDSMSPLSRNGRMGRRRDLDSEAKRRRRHSVLATSS